MFTRGFCVMHLQLARNPVDPNYVLVPDQDAWAPAEAYALEHTVAWWDHNPVFPTREEADQYAWLAPVETEIASVEYADTEQPAEDGWFDSFRSPYWFRTRPD